MKLYLFDDAVADGWTPFALTRPCGELRFGRWLLRERLERFAGVEAAGAIARPWLARFRERGAPPVVDLGALPREADRLLLCARAVPAPDAAFRPPEGPANLWIGERLAGCWLPAGRPGPESGWLRGPEPLPDAADVAVDGAMPEAPWDLVARGAERLGEDLRRLAGAGDARAPDLPPGVGRIGEEPVRLGAGVRLEPGVLLDAREGPIVLDEGVEVRAGARLSGPLYAGPRSRLLGGPIASLSAGPYSYLRGEVEAVTVLGYANKAHDGFLGHAYLGRWVNLGALTTNSDLKNNYGTVRVGPPGEEMDTGLLKVGCFLGDHVKTGIGTLLPTGAVVGAGSNVFGAAMPPRWIPPFSWGGGERWTAYRREAFLETAEVVLGRRGVAWDDDVSAWLAAAWDAGRTP